MVISLNVEILPERAEFFVNLLMYRIKIKSKSKREQRKKRQQ